MLLTLRVLLVVAAVTIACAACPSPEWKQYGDMCYWRSDHQLSWPAAFAACPTLFPGADLVSIHDLQQDAFIAEELLGGDRAWIGLRCAGDTTPPPCAWTDGTPYNYTNWYRHLTCSVNCCGSINYVNEGDWYGFDCEHDTWYFVCQISVS